MSRLGSRGSVLLLAAGIVALSLVIASASGAVGASAEAPSTSGLIRVPQDAPSLDAAIAASRPGTIILLDEGTYPGGVLVPEDRPGITIRGVDRNSTVLDGDDQRDHAIEVLADDVHLENLTAHNYRLNGFYWEGVEGFTGRYLTVWNVGLYGIYAIESRNGLFEHSFVSGAADAAYYIGECNPCNAVLRDLVARYSAIGYSGTNAGGGLEIRDSVWELNGTGILPNSYEGQEAPPPQRASRIVGNTIRGSGSVPVPANSPLAGFIGLGIGIAGGEENVVERNVIEGSAAYGIALFPTLQESGASFLPRGNVIRDNEVSNSGKADLAVALGSAKSNCFQGNGFQTSLPAEVETSLGCNRPAGSEGDASVARTLAVPIPVALQRLGKRPAYTEMPIPSAQPAMPSDPARPQKPAADTNLMVLVGVLVAVAAGVVLALMVRRRRTR